MKAKTVTTRCWAEASPSAPAPAVSPPAKPRGRSSAPPGPMFCHSRHGSPRRGPNGKTPALAPVRSHFAARNRAAGHRPHRGRCFAIPVTARRAGAPTAKPRRLLPFGRISLRETARPVIGPTGADVLPFPSRLRRAGAPTAKPRRPLPAFLTLRK